MDLLLAEVNAIETALKDFSPINEGVGTAAQGRAGAKERIETIAQLTRTLEKLIDVKRAEGADVAKLEGDDAETERLRDELLNRLKILDQRRAGMTGTVSQKPTARQARPNACKAKAGRGSRKGGVSKMAAESFPGGASSKQAIA